MTVETATRTVSSLDEVIGLAGKGPASAEVTLTTRHLIDTVRLELGQTEQVESYLLAADFDFRTPQGLYRYSSIYMHGHKGEPLEAYAANRRIANFRLQQDYRQLEEAGIEVEEQYFEEFRMH